ncbi:MAG: sensor histidine kinase [Bryobacteraceae bacterium]
MSAPTLRIDDRPARLIFTPVLGVAIPLITGLFRHLPIESPAYWLGFLYTTFVSFVIWHGNRFLLPKMGSQPDWLHHPRRRLASLLLLSSFYTVPVSTLLLWLWYRMTAAETDWNVLRATVLLTLISVFFIVHSYETVYLIRQRTYDRIAYEKVERAKAQAELASLREQVDPHFMFNCLNTLAGLTEEDPERATEFTVAMANVYRYILRTREQDLVPLRDEMDFLRAYYSLLRLRFDDGVQLVTPSEAPSGVLIPPAALQMALENAVKHNEFSGAQPLVVKVEWSDGEAVVTNAKSPRPRPAETAALGLRNLDERYRLTMQRPIQVLDAEGRFQLRLPLSDSRVEAVKR